MTLTDWLARLAPGPLPIFDHTRGRLTEQRRRAEEITAREVAQTILGDPFATCLLLHAANQRGGRLAGEVTTAESALLMRGIGGYLEQARTLPVLEDSQFGRDHKRLAAIHALLRRVHHATWQARDFAVLHSDVRSEEVQVAIIAHALPEFLLLLRAPTEALRLLRLKRRLPAEDAEVEILGITLEQLRQPLLSHWNIPQLTRDLLNPELAEKSRQAIIKASIDIADRMRLGWWDEALLGDYITLAGIENLPLEIVIATVHANAMRAERAGHWIPVPGAGVWMPMIPGPWPEEPEEEEHAPAPVAPPVVAPEQKPEPIQHTACPMPDKGVLREALDGIESHLDGSLNLNQMSAIILKGLHTGLGLSRIIFAMVAPDGKLVKSRFTLGIKPDDPLRQFVFDMTRRDLFGQLMGKMQGVWVNESNRAKFWPMLHPTLQQMIGAGDFYAMSLHANGKPVGFVYADRGHGECGLDPLTYTDFKMLCLQAARGLGKLKQG